MSQRFRYLLAGLFREWTRTRAWILGLWLVALGGPLIHLVNAIAASSSIRVDALFQSLYMTQTPGFTDPLDYIHHQLVQIDFRTPAPLHIVGYPVLSLWIIAIAMFMGAGLVTMDRHSAAMADVLSFPFPKRSFVLSKAIWGCGWLLAMGVSRSILTGALSMVSPWHGSISTLVWSFVLNVVVAWAVFTVSLWISIGVHHVLLAWCSAFLGLTLPLTFGAVVRFVGTLPGLSSWSYRFEHQFMLKLSPFWYTDYTTQWVQHFVHKPIVGAPGIPVRVKSVTMFTSVSHPWWMVMVSIGLSVVCMWLSIRAFGRMSSEENVGWFGSGRWFHGVLAMASVTFGSVGTQIINHTPLASFLVLSAVCYGGLWGMALTLHRRWSQRIVFPQSHQNLLQ